MYLFKYIQVHQQCCQQEYEERETFDHRTIPLLY